MGNEERYLSFTRLRLLQAGSEPVSFVFSKLRPSQVRKLRADGFKTKGDLQGRPTKISFCPNEVDRAPIAQALHLYWMWMDG